MEIEKIPSLTCKECGSFKVIMTSDGLECSECSPSIMPYNDIVNLSEEIEYLIYQFKSQGD